MVPPGRIKRAFVVKCAQLFENLVSNSLLNLEMTPGELLKTQLQPNPKCGVELINRFQRPPLPPALPVNRWIQFSSKGFVSQSCLTLLQPGVAGGGAEG